MCGICGFLGNWNKNDLAKLNNALANRGPDGEGTFFSSLITHHASLAIGLGHRRLSIIDLSEAAAQPMEAVGGRYQIVFNGEIYNFKELREDIESKGYTFNKNSDTAVIAPLIDAYGLDALDMLEGMFAFALWDSVEQELLLVRDALGIKPMYYYATSSGEGDSMPGIAFASELKALVPLLSEDAATNLDPIALAEYLTFLWTPGERTMLSAIKKLLPGHWLKLKVTPSGILQTSGRWYTSPQAPLVSSKPQYDASKTPAQLLKVLDDVVDNQCVADVPLGAFLSGGVDSSAVVASMVARGHTPKNCYCIGFSGADMTGEGFSDDLSHAQDVAKHLGVTLTEVRVGPEEILSELKELAWMLDEPQADPAPLLVKKIAERARADGIKVLMSGTGGDDIMTGYRRHLAARIRQYTTVAGMPFGKMAALPLGTLSRYVKYKPLRRRMAGLAKLLGGSDDDFLISAFATNGIGDARTLFTPAARTKIGDWNNGLTRARSESEGQDLVNRMLSMELAGFLPDHNLNYSDKASMAAGVEVRVPLIDKRLVAWMADVSPKNKLHQTRLKSFFKDATSPRLPQKVVSRSKAGFGAPVRTWLVGPGAALVEETLFSPNTSSYPQLTSLLDSNAIKHLWTTTRSGEIDGAYTILALCMAHWWLQGLHSARAGA